MSSGMSTADPRVVVYVRPGCHLCENAVAIIDQVCAEVGATYAEQDISGSPDLLSEYGEQIPVTFVDGEQHDFWHVNPARLRAALERRS